MSCKKRHLSIRGQRGRCLRNTWGLSARACACNAKNVCVKNSERKCVWFWGQNVAGKLLCSSLIISVCYYGAEFLWQPLKVMYGKWGIWDGLLITAQRSLALLVCRRCKRKYVKCSNKTALHMFFWCGFSGRRRHASRSLTAAPKTLGICCPLQRKNLPTRCDFPCSEKSLHDINAPLCWRSNRI